MKKLRQQFADTMCEVGKEDPNLVVLVGDISHGILQPFAQCCPGRYFNVGICEPTIVNMAAGMRKTGLNMVVHTIAPFIIERGYEQIKLDFGYQKLGINLISVGGAFDYSQLGCSHHCYSDLALIGQFAGAKVFSPGSAEEFDLLFKECYQEESIHYFKLTENPHGIHFNPQDIKVGQAVRVREGKDLTLVALGPRLKDSLEVADYFSKQGVEVEVLYYHTFKPFDSKSLQESVLKTRRLLVVEEHSPLGGLYHQAVDAVKSIDSVTYGSINIPDFVHCYGTYNDLLNEIGMDVSGIIQKISSTFSFMPNLRKNDALSTH